MTQMQPGVSGRPRKSSFQPQRFRTAQRLVLLIQLPRPKVSPLLCAYVSSSDLKNITSQHLQRYNNQWSISLCPFSDDMVINTLNNTPALTFISTNGPTLNASSVRAVRAHTTKGNFKTRRQRLVREHIARAQQLREDAPLSDSSGLIYSQPSSSCPSGLCSNLDYKDAFLIDNCA